MIHKPVRRWPFPFEKVCACGNALPCPVKMSLDRHAQDAQVQEAVDDLIGLRDELYRAGYDVPMPADHRPMWDEATTWVPPVRPPLPLLTPGAAARSRLGQHRWR